MRCLAEKFSRALLALCLLMAALPTVPGRAAAAVALAPANAPRTPAPPAVEAAAAILVEADTGQVLFEKNAQLPLPMASTTKIMTALVALEYGHLDDIVTAGERAARIDGTRIYLEPGEKETMRDLLYALMLPSANDAAVAIAEHIAGSEEAFVAMMNQKARTLGANHTYFQDPHGLSSRGHYTTAHDLALITRAAMRNPLFAQIVATKEYLMPWPAKLSVRRLYNHNKLLWRDLSAEGFAVTGVKTGYTSAAGNCLVASARRGDRQVIAVILNSPPGVQFSDAVEMFRFAFSGFQQHKVVRRGDVVVSRPVGKGFLPVIADRSISVALPVGKPPAAVRKEFDWKVPPEPPIAQGEQLGELRVLLDGREVGRAGLLSAATVVPPRPKHWWLLPIAAWVALRAVAAANRRLRKARRARRRPSSGGCRQAALDIRCRPGEAEAKAVRGYGGVLRGETGRTMRSRPDRQGG